MIAVFITAPQYCIFLALWIKNLNIKLKPAQNTCLFTSGNNFLHY